MIDVILALEQIVALLIDIELRQPQIGDARVHIRQQRALRQALLLLIQNARQHQAALQHLNLLFQVTFRLQTAIEPVFDPNILLEQGVALLGGGDQLLTQLAVDVQLLADQPIVLDIGGVFRILRLFGGFSDSVRRLLLTSSCSSCTDRSSASICAVV